VATFKNPTDTIVASLTDEARADFARLFLGRVAFKFSGWAVGREGYDDSDPTQVDALVTADTELGDQMYPHPYGDDVEVLSHFDDDLNLDYVRGGGTKTATTGGTPAIVSGSKFGAGAAALIGANDRLDYTGAGIVDALEQTGCIEFWLQPQYSGTPTATQYIYSSAQAASNANDKIEIYHASGTGTLYAVANDQDGSQISLCQGAFSPDGSSFYHFSYNWDVVAGTPAQRLFVGGVQVGSTQTGAGTRGGLSQILRLGQSNTSTTLTPDFVMDELVLYNAVQRTAAFSGSLPTAPLTPTVFADFLDFEVLLPNTIAPVCRLLQDEALYGLGELGIWVEVTVDTDTPARVGDKYLFAQAHFPMHAKTLQETTIWRVIFMQ
jgi:hypothetical protein